MRTPAGPLLATALAIIALAGSAGAGQVFVDVGAPAPNVNRYLPQFPGVSTLGDFVIWTWVAGKHSVTSGIQGSPTGIFDSDPLFAQSASIGTVFAWKTDRPGTIPFSCRESHTPVMSGSITFLGTFPPPPMADFRITEVRFDGIGSNFVEIANLGTADGNLRGFRLSINGGIPATPASWNASTTLLAGLRIAVPDPGGLTSAGSVALYVPYLAGSLPYTALATNDSMMVDYVEWGTSAGQPLEDTAVKVLTPTPIWFAGQFAPQAKPGHSIVFCGTSADHGSAVWNESTIPTPGTFDNCVNPTRASTWGRIKVLYR